MSTVALDRIYLVVPYREKEQAKQMIQARWDGDSRRWYASRLAVTKNPSSFKWLPPGPLRRELKACAEWAEKNGFQLEAA